MAELCALASERWVCGVAEIYNTQVDSAFVKVEEGDGPTQKH